MIPRNDINQVMDALYALGARAILVSADPRGAALRPMTLAVRVIPCLDVAAGRVVKGVNFQNLRDTGDPVELAAPVLRAGRRRAHVPRRHRHRRRARRPPTTWCGATAEQVFIPLTVGGGVRSRRRRRAPASATAPTRSASTSAAIARPELDRRDRRPVRRAGARALARRQARRDAHARRASSSRRTAAAPRPTSTRSTGRARPSSAARASCWSTRSTPTARSEGFDLELVALMRELASVPVIASGGAGAASSDFAARRSPPAPTRCSRHPCSTTAS